MKVTIGKIKEIRIAQMDMLTLEQFININQSDEVLGWVDGYILKFSFYSNKVFDEGIENGIWKYRALDAAPMPEFQKEIQFRHAKVPVFDMTGNGIMEAIVKEIKNGKNL